MFVHKILLVDDKPENLYSLENMLMGDNLSIYKAHSGQEALKLAFKEDFSLILLDVQMPDMDGFEVAHMLKSTKRTRKIPVLLVTALNKERHYMLRGLDEGAIDYLFKPLDPDVTRAKVKTLLTLFSQQKEMEELNKRLQQLNEEKNYMLGVASHDLRNPIGNIITLAGFIENESTNSLSPQHREYLEIIQRSGQELIQLINDLLDISQLESGKRNLEVKEIHLQDLFEIVIAENKAHADRKNIELHYSISDESLKLSADYLQMKQVLNNLVSNAIKFSHTGKSVELTAALKDENIHISVIDQGQGIPANELNLLFKPFITSSVRSTGGEKSTGLGLVITKKLIEQHGGALSVDSEQGKGSVFTIVMPQKMNQVYML
jgi:signal transduction histidine kinase